MLTVIDQLGALDQPITVAVVGAGAMGRGLVHQLATTPGLRCVAVADVRPERAVAAAQACDAEYCLVDDPDGLRAAVAAGRLAVCREARLLADRSCAEVLLEASSAVVPAAETALAALAAGQHLVLMNSEIDAAFGPRLRQLALDRGVIMTSCDGDQHGVIKRLWDEVVLWGLEPVMAGNIKGFLGRAANPTSIAAEADARRLDHRMCAAYTDGTKLNIEMSLLANALGLGVAQPGMLGPRAEDVRQVPELFDLAGLRTEHGALVDYVLGAEPGGGVFVVGYTEDPYRRDMLRYYKMGDGPFYLYWRPCHLCHFEVAGCLLAAARWGQALLAPTQGLRTQVIAYAKRALAAGELLDGVGGYTCHGQIEPTAGAEPGLPIVLAENVRLRRPVALGERLAWRDVDLPEDRLDVLLHRQSLAASP